MILLVLFACAWPSSLLAPSQPLIVEVSIGDTANASNASGSDSPTPEGAPEAEAAPEAPVIWYMAGAAGRLVAEVVYKQRVYQLSNSAGLQTVGPWTLLRIDTAGLKLRYPNGDTLTVPAPQPGERPPLFAPPGNLPLRQ